MPGARPEHSDMGSVSELPHFPEFEDLSDEHKAPLQEALRAARPLISEFTFAYLWCWLPYTSCRLARHGEHLLLMALVADSEDAYLLPPVTAEPKQSAQLIAELAPRLHETPADRFARVPHAVVRALGERAGLKVVDERNRADYVYRAEDLRELPGRDYRRKRNHVRQFWTAHPEAQCREIDAELAAQCAAFSRQWLRQHPGRGQPGLRREVETTVRFLENWDWLGLSGVCLLADERIAAFALGESLSEDTFLERVEKADTSFPGAYQAINREFARRAAAGFEWINREQDLGVPGLRRAKQSYRPDHLVRKYRITPP